MKVKTTDKLMNIAECPANREARLLNTRLNPKFYKSVKAVFFDSAFIILGVTALTLLAQLKLRLSFTPVPITGQTFGVALIAMSFGRRRSVMAVLTYLLLGEWGFPVFSQVQPAWHLSATSGYLFGMLVSSWVVPWLSDRGYGRTYVGILLLSLLSSYIIFTFGLFGLSFFVRGQDLLILGYWPFLPGDCLKIFSAALTVIFFQRVALKKEDVFESQT